MCIIGIFLITSVSATDLNQTDAVQLDDNDLNLEMNGIDSSDEGSDTISVTDESGCSTEQLKTDENDALKEGPKTIPVPTKTFTGINDAINSANDGDTIILDGTYKQDIIWQNNWLLSAITPNSIVINKQLNFVGVNGAVLEGISEEPFGANKLRLTDYYNFVKINSNGVTFKNIIFTSSKGVPSLYSSYSFSMDNCTFCNNNEYVYIYNQGESYTFWSDGMAIYLKDCVNATITNSKFISNSGISGGAIYISGNSKVKIINSNFTDNYATDYGGAVAVTDSSKCDIINCYFEGNSANLGGALSGGNVVNCTFIDNSASASGGAIHIRDSSDDLVDNCNFVDNHATNFGGAIDAYQLTNFTVFDCNFTNCYCNNNRGGAFASDSCNGLKIFGCNFDSCHANQAGAVRIDATTNFNIENCNFVNNSASDSAGTIRIGEYNGVYSSNGVINNCNFADSHATTYGGCIDAYGTSNLDILNCNFMDCYCENNEGGAISSDSCSNVNISGCKFDSCNANYAGGAIRIKAGNNFGINGSTFINCSSQYGGFIHVGENDKGKSSNVVIDNCNFSNASSNHGLIHIEKSTSVSIRNSILENIVSSEGASVVDACNMDELYLDNCKFSNCSGKYGAVGLFGTVNDINLNNSEFTNCHSANDGGAVYWNAGQNLLIEYCNFKDCTSDDGGNYIKFNNGMVGNVANCIFDVNPSNIDYYYTSILEVNDTMSVVKGDTVILAAKLRYLFGSLSYKTVTFRIYHENKLIDQVNQTTYMDGSIDFDVTQYLSDLGEYTITASFAGEGKIRPVSNTSNIQVNSYIGILTVNCTGKYYGDTSLNVKLINSRTNSPIQYSPIKVVFSNGKTVSFDTDENGLYTYNLPESFTPGSYNATVYVDRGNVSVNVVDLNNILINELNGEIEITQLSGSRILSVKLYNKTTGDVFKNVGLSLEFSPNRAYVDHLTTNDKGIVTYRMSFDVGTYSVIAKVSGNYRHFEISELKDIVINSDSGSADEFPSVITFGGPISFDYLKTGSTTFSTVYCSISLDNISVIGHPEIKPKIVGNRIVVSGLDVGTYTLRVVTTPNAGYYSVLGFVNITVTKVSAVIKASTWSDYPKSKKVWTIKLYDSKTKVALSNMQVILKVFKGNKLEKTLKYNTNSKGEISLKPGSWSVGTHRVVISFSRYGYSCNQVTSYVKVLKPTKLTFIVRSVPDTDGTSVSIWVKVGKKPVKNGFKILLYVHTGKKYKLIPLFTGTYKTVKNKVYKGFVGYGTNLYSAGYHKIIVKPASLKYTGIKNSKFYIKKGANKGAKSETIISKGKEKYIYYRSK